MTEIRAGCSGWSYPQWIGPFYPPGTRPSDFLKFYSRLFDFVEIDSTFYRIPNPGTVETWAKSVPENFLFSPKMPKQITHDLRLKNFEIPLQSFIESISNFGHKLGMIVIQLAPSFSYQESFEDLKNFMGALPEDRQFGIEFRHNSWFREDLFDLLRRSSVTFVWSEIPYVMNPGITTTGNAYLRLVGDRSIREEDFGKVIVGDKGKINEWSRKLNEEKYGLDHVFVSVNNHFQGFAPGTVNLFRTAIGQEPIDWQSRNLNGSAPRQAKLF